jgi:hypothetical protein
MHIIVNDVMTPRMKMRSGTGHQGARVQPSTDLVQPRDDIALAAIPRIDSIEHRENVIGLSSSQVGAIGAMEKFVTDFAIKRTY